MSIQPTPWHQKPIQYVKQGSSFAYSNAKVALRILHEGQKMTTHFVTGGAFNFLGKRVAIGTNNPMKNPYLPLQQMDGELAIFEQHQPPDAKNIKASTKKTDADSPADIIPTQPILSLAPSSAVTPAIEPSNPSTVIDQIAETDRQLEIFSNNLTYFIPIYTMATLGGINDPDVNKVVLSMVTEAASTKCDGSKPSVKDIFYKTYGHRLNITQRIKIWFFNIFGNSSIFSKTVDAYMKHILKEMRERLSYSRWTEKGENVERLIDDIIHFLDLYKNATFNYAEAKEPTGGLHQYRSAAFEKIFQKSLQDLCQEFSRTLVEFDS